MSSRDAKEAGDNTKAGRQAAAATQFIVFLFKLHPDRSKLYYNIFLSR